MIEYTGRVVTGPSISAALATRQLDRARDIFPSTTRVLTALSWPLLPVPGVLRTRALCISSVRASSPARHPLGNLPGGDALDECRWRAVGAANER